MHVNILLCHICKKPIKEHKNNYDKVVYVGKDIITGKKLYRHKRCKYDFKKVKERKFWKINPRTRIKESGKKYNRKKEKERFRKEMNDE